jgi:hypothetical protein
MGYEEWDLRLTWRKRRMSKSIWYQHLIPRAFHCLYAHLQGYFWLPCPICGKMFGGHETAATGFAGLMTGWDEGKMVCPNCVEEAEKRNKEFMARNPAPKRSDL